MIYRLIDAGYGIIQDYLRQDIWWLFWLTKQSKKCFDCDYFSPSSKSLKE